MYAVNDMVLYGRNGACKIVDITKREVAGSSIEYYVLQPVYNQASTIFVPTGNQTLTGKMRQVLSADEIHALIRSLPDEQSLWIEDEEERRARYSEILSGGNRRDIVRMIKALYLHREELKERGKHLHLADERFLKDAERLLYDEFALVLQIQPDQVLPFILQQIKVTGKTE